MFRPGWKEQICRLWRTTFQAHTKAGLISIVTKAFARSVGLNGIGGVNENGHNIGHLALDALVKGYSRQKIARDPGA